MICCNRCLKLWNLRFEAMSACVIWNVCVCVCVCTLAIPNDIYMKSFFFVYAYVDPKQFIIWLETRRNISEITFHGRTHVRRNVDQQPTDALLHEINWMCYYYCTIRTHTRPPATYTHSNTFICFIDEKLLRIIGYSNYNIDLSMLIGVNIIFQKCIFNKHFIAREI